MSKVDAPAPEPTKKASPKKAQVRPRGKYIDFAPRRKRRPVATQEPEASVVEVTTRTETVEPTLVVADPEPTTVEAIYEEPELDTKLAILDPEYEEEIQEDQPAEELFSEEQPAEELTPVEQPFPEEQLVEELAPVEQSTEELAPVEQPSDELDSEPDLTFDDQTNLSDLDKELLEFEDALKNFADDPSEDLDNFVDEAFDGVDEEDKKQAIIEEEQTDFVAEVDADEYVATISGVTTKTTVKESPFLKDYQVEKRPLSDRVPETLPPLRPEAIEPTEHEEFDEKEFVERLDKAPEPVPVVTDTEKSGSKIGMIITVLITILLGVGVGVFVYLAFFQKS